MENDVVPILKDRFVIENPWDHAEKYKKEFLKISKLPLEKQITEMKKMNKKIGKSNQNMIDKSEFVLAILDGVDVDSGVASEIGYAFGKNKKIFGYRSDFRQTGDNSAAIVNLQVEFFIQKSGGKIFQSLKEIKLYKT